MKVKIKTKKIYYRFDIFCLLWTHKNISSQCRCLIRQMLFIRNLKKILKNLINNLKLYNFVVDRKQAINEESIILIHLSLLPNIISVRTQRNTMPYSN